MNGCIAGFLHHSGGKLKAKGFKYDFIIYCLFELIYMSNPVHDSSQVINDNHIKISECWHFYNELCLLLTNAMMKQVL